MRPHRTILLGLLLGTACQSATAPYADVRVVTSVAASGIAAAPIMVSTTLTNESTRAVTFSIKTCPRRFRVETVSGVVIDFGSQICTLEAQSATLAPGGRYQLDEFWNGKGADGAPLVGTYRVVGEPFRTAGPESAPVTVELPR